MEDIKYTIIFGNHKSIDKIGHILLSASKITIVRKRLNVQEDWRGMCKKFHNPNLNRSIFVFQTDFKMKIYLTSLRFMITRNILRGKN